MELLPQQLATTYILRVPVLNALRTFFPTMFTQKLNLNHASPQIDETNTHNCIISLQKISLADMEPVRNMLRR